VAERIHGDVARAGEVPAPRRRRGAHPTPGDYDSRTYARFFVMGLAGAVTLYVIVLLSFGVFGR
jgi:hypothetical protein